MEQFHLYRFNLEFTPAASLDKTKYRHLRARIGSLLVPHTIRPTGLVSTLVLHATRPMGFCVDGHYSEPLRTQLFMVWHSWQFKVFLI